jgi:hypothetical protein
MLSPSKHDITKPLKSKRCTKCTADEAVDHVDLRFDADFDKKE